MLVLDTNTLYYACGLSEPPQNVDKEQLLQTIRSAGMVVISYVSLAEFLTKYRKNARIIRKTCAFMRNYNIHVIDCEYMRIDSLFVKQLTTIRQKNFDEAFKPIFNVKIDIESRFASIIFFVLLICETIFECNIDPNNLSAPVFVFLSDLFKIIRSTFVDVFNALYLDAYKTNDAENYIRIGMYRLLDTFIPIVIPLCQKVLRDIANSVTPEDVDLSQLVNEYQLADWVDASQAYHNKIDKQKTPIHFIHRRGLSYGKSINDKQLQALLTGLDNSIRKIVGQNSIDEYLIAILTKCISRGGAFRKNDINDALILCTLKPCDVIITFDNGMITHLQNHSTTRKEYQNSLALINNMRTSM